MRNQVLKITKDLFEEYKDGFIYVDTKQLNFKHNEISGKFQFTGSAYLNTYSKILNNTEAMFIFNQLQYVLLGSIFIQKGIINPNNQADSYTKLDGIVYKDMRFNFKKMITEEQDLNYTCRADHFTDKKGRDCFTVYLDLVDGAFEIAGTAVCLNSAVHGNGLYKYE